MNKKLCNLKKCCYIIPYFGKLPNYFPLFLQTCEWNPDFNWLIITDDETKYDYPKNVKVKRKTFCEMQTLVNSKFDFEVTLDSPYKLCDYKPAYGYIFEEYIQDYWFWGHCDTDILMGNLSKFITDDLLNSYDKLFCLGHMTLYRNNYENNRVFMSLFKEELLYKKVFSTNSICWFDEEYKDENNINRIFLNLNKRVLVSDLSINFRKSKFKFLRTKYVGDITKNSPHGYVTEKYRRAIYIWKEGNIYRLYRSKNKQQLEQEDFAYMHLQSRKMKFNKQLIGSNTIKVIPNSFERLEYSNVKLANLHNIKNLEVMPFCKYLLIEGVKIIFPKFFKEWLKKLKFLNCCSK